MTDIGIRDISVSFRDNKISNISLVQGDALTRGFDITFVNAKGETLPVDDDYIVELVAVNSKDKDTPYACRHEIVDDKYRVMIPPEALSESGSVTIQLVFYQKSTKAVIHTIKQKCPVYQSIGQEFVESNNLYVDITALRLGLEKIEKLDGKYEEIIEKDMGIQANEAERKEAEKKRNLEEVIRQDNETIRKSNEDIRISAEDKRVKEEAVRIENEKQRGSNEIKRENNEDVRIDNESKRVTAEADRTVIFNEMTESLEDYKTPLATDIVAGKVKVDKIPTETGEITVPSVGKLSEEIQLISIQYDSTDTPGGKISIGEESEKDAFFGEVSSDELITGDDLALKLGLTAGNSTNSDAGWLKFMYKGKIQFVAKKHFRTRINWASINDANAVYGDKIIEIKRKAYKVRLLRGIGEDVQPNPKVYQPKYNSEANHYSEWNELLCPISVEAPDNWGNPLNVLSPTKRLQITYTNEELDSYNVRSWCQETSGGEDRRCTRGKPDLSFGGHGPTTYGDSTYGWRPVLELVE